MVKEKILPYKCKCGGKLKKSQTQVEFFGIDFGIKECEVCTACGSEYLGDEVMEEIEQEIKKRGIFGLERRVQVTKSGNSLVIRVPPEIAKFSGIQYKDQIRMYPIEKNRIEMDIIQ